jgi:hypothetical protein
MPERFVQLGGASVNAREKWATHWLLGIFDTVGCPLIVNTDSSGLWLLAEWHEVKQNAGCVAWDLAAIGSHHASPVCMRIHILIVQEVTRWFRT